MIAIWTFAAKAVLSLLKAVLGPLVAFLYGKARTERKAARDALKQAKEAKNIESEIDRLTSVARRQRLRKWTRE